MSQLLFHTLRTVRNLCAVVASSFFMLACNPQEPDPPSLNPRIASVQVEQAIQGVPPLVTVNVVVPGAANKSVKSVQAALRSTLQEGRPFIPVDTEFSGQSGQWLGELPALNTGPYELELTVVLRQRPGPDGSVGLSPDEFLTTVEAFAVGVDTQECFNFAAAAAEDEPLMGWQHGGFHAVDAQHDPPAGCSENLTVFNGNLTTLMGLDCQSPDAFYFDLTSPDVTARPAWAESQGAVFTAGWNIPGVQMQPIFTRLPDTLPALAPVDDNGDWVFYSMSGVASGLQRYRIPMQIEEGNVSRLTIRFFGEPMTTVAEGFARLGYICPLPDRPG